MPAGSASRFGRLVESISGHFSSFRNVVEKSRDQQSILHLSTKRPACSAPTSSDSTATLPASKRTSLTWTSRSTPTTSRPAAATATALRSDPKLDALILAQRLAEPDPTKRNDRDEQAAATSSTSVSNVAAYPGARWYFNQPWLQGYGRNGSGYGLERARPLGCLVQNAAFVVSAVTLKSEDRKLRLGVAGIGSRGLAVVRDAGGARGSTTSPSLTCGPDRFGLRRRYPAVSTFGSIDALSSRPKLTPSGSPPRASTRRPTSGPAAADRGKHVILEKPMALNLADAEKALAASERSESRC